VVVAARRGRQQQPASRQWAYHHCHILTHQLKLSLLLRIKFSFKNELLSLASYFGTGDSLLLAATAQYYSQLLAST
jgi:hypothetical protein